MPVTSDLFKVDGKVLCDKCLARLEDKPQSVRRTSESTVCESCGAKLRIVCAHCGRFHIDPTRDIEEQERWCADQERISIEAERLEFYDNWL